MPTGGRPDRGSAPPVDRQYSQGVYSMPIVQPQEKQNGGFMGELGVLRILIGVGVWLYRSGKRIGSRKGFHVGRDRARRRW